jgi:hypothetical protein
MNPNTLPSPDRIDPNRLTVLLEEAGWRLVGGDVACTTGSLPPG